MLRVSKWLAIALGGVVLVVGGALLALPHLVDPNDHKQTISRAVTEKTGRPFEIPGDLKLTVFPWLGVEVGPIYFGQPEGFNTTAFAPNTPFLEARAAHIRVKLLPLLASRVEMDTVVAEGLTINLARTADGRTNWEDLFEPERTPSEGPNIGSLALGGLSLRDAAVHVFDGQAKRRLALRKVTLKTGPIALNTPVRIETELDLQAEDPALGENTLNAHVKGSAEVQLGRGGERLLVDALMLNVALTNEAGEQAEVSLRGTLDFGMASKSITAPKLQGALATASYYGNAADLAATLTNVIVDLNANTVATERFESQGTVSGNALHQGKADFAASGRATLELNQANLEVTKLALNVPAVSYRGTEGRFALRANITGKLDEQRFDVQGLDLETTLSGSALQGGKAALNIKGDLGLDLADFAANSERLEVTADELEIAGYKGTFRAVSKLAASPAQQQFRLIGFFADGALTEQEILGGTVPFVLRGDILVDLRAQRARAKKLRVEAAGFDIKPAKGTLSLDLAQAVADLARGTLGAETLELSAKLTGKAAFDGEASGRLIGSGISANNRLVSMKDFRLGLPGLNVGGNRVTLDARGALEADLSGSRVTLSRLKAKGHLEGPALQGGVTHFDGTSNASYQFSEGDFELSKLRVALAELRYADLKGSAQIAGNIVGNAARGVYSAEPVRVRGKIAGKAIPGRSITFNASSDANVNLKTDSLRASNLVASAAGINVKGALNVSALTSAPSYKGTLAIEPFNPRPLIKRLGLGAIKTADPSALKRLSARAALSGAPGRLALENLVVQLDESTAKGAVSLSGMDGAAARPFLRFDLALNGLDADRYTAPPARKAPAHKPDALPSGALPLGMLAAVDLEGKLHVGKLKANNLKVSNLKLIANGKDRKLDLVPVTANLYRGSVSAKGSLDISKPAPTISVEKQFRGVQAGQLLTDLSGAAPITGTADFDISLRSTGKTRQELIGNANGTTRFEMRDGTLEGVNIVREICGQLRQFGIVTAQSVRADQTPFSNLSGTGQIRNGVLYNDDMSITSPFLRIAGRGNVQFLNEVLGYAVTAHLVDSCEGQGRGLVEDLLDVPIPIRITGPIRKPRFGFDFDRLVESLAQKQIEKQGSRLIEKALGGDRSGGTSSGKGEDVIKGLLKGLFK